VHELAVTQGLLELALRHAGQAGGVRVTDLHLVIGELASIVDDSVSFYWDHVSQGTPAEGARLHFRRVPAELTCEDCGLRFGWDQVQGACPGCSGARVRVSDGEQFHLESIEVER
jgi:hydrogenase nickel incorporation protein HypA/HybF